MTTMVSRMPRRIVPLALCAIAAVPGCTKSPPPSGGAATVAAPAVPLPKEDLAEQVFLGGLKNDWQDWGWAPRKTQGPGPAEIHFTNWGGWILAKQALKQEAYGALVFRVKPPPGEAEFLEVRVESPNMTTFPRIKLRAEHRAAGADGWYDVRVPMSELNPDATRFDRVIFRAFRAVDDQVTLLDGVGLTRADAQTASARLNPASYATTAKPVSFHVSCEAKATKVSPLIYGIAYYPETDGQPAQWAMGATGRRWGGNHTSRYNWEAGFWNLTEDWFYENKPAAMTWEKFLDDNDAHGVLSAITIPTIGWVAKDGTSAGFPVTTFGAQEKTDPWNKDAGNGMSTLGKKLPPGPPTQTSVAAPPEFMKRWAQAIKARETKKGKRSVAQYILDNEPMNWTNKHRDVRTEPLGYDELVDRAIKYGTAIREGDPDAVIAGPAEWGWTGYFYSGKDAPNFTMRPDRRAHDDLPLVEWYLKKLHENEQKTGVRALDVLDLHFYPSGENVYGNGGLDSKTSALRLRSTRSWWDPTYVEESWIKEPVRLLPRMKEWIAKNYPGRGISIGEWNFGGEGHITGALAIAESLGRFAQFGVQSAFYWTHPADGAPGLQGFVAYRNFDGKGAHFLDWFVPATSSGNASIFASRDEGGRHLVAIAVNMSPEDALLAKFDLGTCGEVTSRRSYAYLRGAQGFVAAPVAEGSAPPQDIVLPPWSITVIDVQLAKAMPGPLER